MDRPDLLLSTAHAGASASGELFDLDVLVVGHDASALQAANAAAQAGARVLLIGHPGKHHRPDGQEGQAVQGVVHLPTASALELLCDTAGRVRGAAGKLADDSAWWALAPAVVLASADCLLMAVEAGAELADIDRPDGGIHRRDDRGATQVPGLWAVGAAAAGSANGLARLSHADRLLSARKAGIAAAAAADAEAQAASRTDPPLSADAPADSPLRPAGLAGLRGPGHHPISPQAAQSALQAVLSAAVEPAAALQRLDALWHFLRSAAPAPRGARRTTREAAQAVALARWRLHSARARTEPRAGVPAEGVTLVLSGGLDHAWARPMSLLPADSPDGTGLHIHAHGHAPQAMHRPAVHPAAPRVPHPVHTIAWASAWAR